MAAEFNGSTNQILRRYVPGAAEDEPVVWFEGSDGSHPRWLLQDHQGSVVAVTDMTGGAIAVNTYSDYGLPGSGNLGRYQYTGQFYLPEVGLYDYKARLYSPTQARFMQTDPVGYKDGLNWYDYVHNDPVNNADPTGEDMHMGGCGNNPCLDSATTVAEVVVTAAKKAGPAVAEGALKVGITAIKFADLPLDVLNFWSMGSRLGSDDTIFENRPPNLTPDGARRNGALRAAKRANNVPTSQPPESQGPNKNKKGDDQPGREYTYKDSNGKTVVIRDDAAGHNYPDDPSQNRGPHFNDPQGDHYDYPPN